MLRDEQEHPIPPSLHGMFQQIVEAFLKGDFELREHSVEGVSPIDPETARRIADAISYYGDGLAPLDPAIWDRSVYIWMDGHWDLLVDLTTACEPVSDLTLHAKLYDTDPPRLEINSVHVP